MNQKQAEGKTAGRILEEFDSQFDWLNARHTNDQWDDYKSFLLSAMKQAAEAVMVEEKDESIFSGAGVNYAIGFNAARQEQLDRRDKFFGV